MKIAISGKGGVGKTTMAALLANSFSRQGLKVIAIDADPDANFAAALGFPKETNIVPLAELKDLIRERVGALPGQSTVYFKMNPKVDDIPERFSVQKDNIKLMVMGAIRRGGTGCACPEHALVKQLLSHLLVQRNEVVVMDMEAGIEHLGRATAQFVDVLLVVVEPTAPSVQTFKRIERLAGDIHIKRLALVINKVRDEKNTARVENETGVKAWCTIPYTESLADYGNADVDKIVKNEIEQLRIKLEQELIHAD